MKTVSILIPTIEARAERLDRTIAGSFRSPRYEVIIERDDGGSNWGTKIAKAAERATGDYLFLAADDIDMHLGWDDAAIAVCDRGQMPAPVVYNPDGSYQTGGETWGEASPDGTVCGWSRFPFLSREQWERFGPTLPIHYSDVVIGKRAKREGVECVVTHGFALTHHFAPEGRKDNDLELLKRLVAEQLDEDGEDVWEIVGRGLGTAIQVEGLLAWDGDEVLYQSCRLVHAQDYAREPVADTRHERSDDEAQ